MIATALAAALRARLHEHWWLQCRRSTWRGWLWGGISAGLAASILSGWLDESVAAWIERWLQWPLICVGLGAGMAWLAIQRRLQAAARGWHAGWWAALPAPAGLHGIALALMAVLSAMPLVAGLALPLAAATRIA